MVVCVCGRVFMYKLLKILPVFILTALVIAGCDFGKDPNMDKVKDVLLQEYGEEVLSDEVLSEETAADETKAETFAFDSECNDADCQEGFYDYMVIAWGEDWETEVDEDMKIAEYEFYLELREQLGMGGGN